MARKKGHAHHGGAWKVAYADFVTAMMALFLVLWLTSQDEKIKEAVERSFKNPFMSVTKDSTGVIPSKDTQAVKSSSGNFDSASAVELNMLRKLSQDLTRTLGSSAENPEDDPVKVEMIPDGMRISIFDRNHQPIFQQDSAEFTDYGKWIFSTLAWEVARYPEAFLVELEGHTEQGRKQRNDMYSSWELSTDRANSARRKLMQHSVQADQIRKVAGFADTAPLPGLAATSESNRRVTVLLRVRSGGRLQ
jgi:chemotaxis protein MotB